MLFSTLQHCNFLKTYYRCNHRCRVQQSFTKPVNHSIILSKYDFELIKCSGISVRYCSWFYFHFDSQFFESQAL